MVVGHGLYCTGNMADIQRGGFIMWDYPCMITGEYFEGEQVAEGAEFVMEHGFLDFITHRKDLKKNVNLYLDLVLNRPLSQA